MKNKYVTTFFHLTIFMMFFSSNHLLASIKNKLEQKKYNLGGNCQYCRKFFKNIYSHKPYCKKNPERKERKKKLTSPPKKCAKGINELINIYLPDLNDPNDLTGNNYDNRCSYCKKQFEDISDHELYCRKNPTNIAKQKKRKQYYYSGNCQYCKKFFKAVLAHELYCKKNSQRKKRKKYYPSGTCKYCRKFFKAVLAHELYCEKNTNSRTRKRKKTDLSGNCKHCDKFFNNRSRHEKKCAEEINELINIQLPDLNLEKDSNGLIRDKEEKNNEVIIVPKPNVEKSLNNPTLNNYKDDDYGDYDKGDFNLLEKEEDPSRDSYSDDLSPLEEKESPFEMIPGLDLD